MNCRRVEKLIPLYVEGDLKSDVASYIASHLDWCGRCNWLADEYKESQGWLRSCDPPPFDEATLTGLKAGVLRQIADTSARPSLWTSLMQQWSRRQVFALSAAALMIFGMVVLYVYQTRAKLSAPTPELAESGPSEETGRPDAPRRPGPDKATGAGLNKWHLSKKRVRFSTSYVKPALARVQPGSRAGAAPDALPTAITNTRFGGSPAMLRIEIQTGDPNIRIIWFAPKETDSHQTKPATD